jgi:ribosomal protein S18 acetylase RimI-like enzyme
MTTTTDRHHAARLATPSDHHDIARVLSSAFADDPVFAWCIPDRSARHALLPDFFVAFARAFSRHEQSHVVESGGALSGAALWAPPGAEAVHEDDVEEFDERIAAACGPWMERLGTAVELFNSAHPHEPAWFLQFVGVAADRQGNGIGSVLLREVLSGADRAGEPAHLIATSPRNRALYERHGFRSVADLTLPDGPTAFAMWREPIAR